MSDTIKLRLWEVGGSPAAYLFSTTPKDKGRDGSQIWIPKSQIKHITRRMPEINQWRECEVELTEWIADKKGLL